MRPLLQKAIPGIEGFFVVRKDFGNPMKNNWQCHAGKAGYDEPYTFSGESCRPLKVKLPVIDFNGSSNTHGDRDNTHFLLEKPNQRHQGLWIFKGMRINPRLPLCWMKYPKLLFISALLKIHSYYLLNKC